MSWLVLAVLYVCTIVTRGEFIIGKFGTCEEYDNNIYSPLLLQQLSASSRLRCIGYCNERFSCIFSFYNAPLNSCRLHKDVSGSGATPQEDWRCWKAASCQAPNALVGGNVVYTSLLVGSSATYSCLPGYTFQGSSQSAICTQEQVWAGLDGRCDPVDCGTPAPVSNGQLSYTTTSYLSTADYTCDVGYEVTGTYTQAVCDVTATWVGLGTCSIVDCGTVPSVANSSPTYTTTTYLSTVTYTCDVGHNAVGSSLTAECGTTGAWTGLTATCEPVDCGVPGSSPFSSLAYTLTTYANLAFYECDNKYVFYTTGVTANITCQASGIWTSLPGTCEMFTDCSDIGGSHSTAPDGVYYTYPSIGSGPLPVYCDMSDGGWTVIQRRMDGSMNFYRTWAEYKQGFGFPTTEFWIGNTNLWRLTNQDNYEIKFDLENWSGVKKYAIYSTFKVNDEANDFRLSISGYSGDAGDAMRIFHNNQRFSTKDRDNDMWGSHCALNRFGGWWYKDCHQANLNGLWNNSAWSDGINWEPFTGFYQSLKYCAMKIRLK